MEPRYWRTSPRREDAGWSAGVTLRPPSLAAAVTARCTSAPDHESVFVNPAAAAISWALNCWSLRIPLSVRPAIDVMSSSTHRARFRYGSLRAGNIVATSDVSPPHVAV